MRFRTCAVAATLAGVLTGCGTARYDANVARDSAVEPTIEVRLPEGSGPFPAVVVLHNCSGLDGPGAAVPRSWSDFLLANGYAVALPDSFRPRGRRGGVCTSPGFDWVAGHIRGADAHKARRLLQANPKIDPARVSVTGGSNGGVATLAAINARMIADGNLGADGKPGFRSAIAFYPECGITYGDWVATKRPPNPVMDGAFESAAPMMILIGASDDWTPAKPCVELVEKAKGAPVTIKVYPGAHHAFDHPEQSVVFNPRATNINNPMGGATTGKDPAALADSREQVLKFLADPAYRP